MIQSVSTRTKTLALAMHWQTCQRRWGLSNATLRQVFDRQPDLNVLAAQDTVHLLALLESGLDDPEQNYRRCGPEHNTTKRLRLEQFVHAFQDAHALSAACDQANAVEKLGIWALTSGDVRYPARLKAVDSSPSIIYGRGDRLDDCLAQPLWITVIGTRVPTYYGQRVTRQITRDLAAQGCVIVSGLARGIDTEAHRTALTHHALTVAVLGCGPDLAYPPENRQLMDQIASQGVLISEHPPGTPALRQHFPARNRILSGLSDVVAVMEAAQRSGTLITAGFAADQGRDVYAVPGSIMDRASSGCHHLIRDGAYLLEQADDILREYANHQAEPTSPGSVSVSPGSVPDSSGSISVSPGSISVSPGIDYLDRAPGLDDLFAPANRVLAGQILQGLRGQDLSLEQLAQWIGSPIQDIISTVSLLELSGQITGRRGCYALTGSAESSI